MLRDLQVLIQFARLMSLLFVSLPAQGPGQTATKYDIKTLTVCTAASQLVSGEPLKSDESGK